MAAVLRELVALQPGAPIHIRTLAPPVFFESISPLITVHPVRTDAGAVETDNTLAIDPAATLAGLRAVLAAKPSILQSESEFLRRAQVRAVIADIPFLAGDIAEAAGIPCIGAGNFTWDWIYEPLDSHAPGFAALLPHIEESYARFHLLLQMPFGQPDRLHHFKSVENIGLVANVSHRTRSQVLGTDDHRPVLFLGMRAALTDQALANAARLLPGHLILHLNRNSPVEGENLRALDSTASFQDAMAAADIVISKLGYGIAAECAATGTDIVYPIRRGFREDDILAPQLQRHVRTAAMTAEEFTTGNWRNAIERLTGHRRPLPADGARQCAQRIAGL